MRYAPDQQVLLSPQRCVSAHPVEACLACAGCVGSNTIVRQGSSPEPPGTRKACLYGFLVQHISRKRDYSVWKTSCIPVHHWPGARSASGSCKGSVCVHHSRVFGSSAIFAISAAKSSPMYSKYAKSVVP